MEDIGISIKEIFHPTRNTLLISPCSEVVRNHDTKMSVNRFLCAIHFEPAGPICGWRALFRPADEPSLLLVYKAGCMKVECCLTAGIGEGSRTLLSGL